jgi:hypothetical protein
MRFSASYYSNFLKQSFVCRFDNSLGGYQVLVAP